MHKKKTIKYKFSQSLSEEVKGKVTHKDFRIIRISPHPLQPPRMENFKDCISFNTLTISLLLAAPYVSQAELQLDSGISVR